MYNKDIPNRKEETDGERKNRTCNSNNPAHDCNGTADTSPKKLKEKATRKGSRPFGGYYTTSENRNGKNHKNCGVNHYIDSVIYCIVEVVTR